MPVPLTTALALHQAGQLHAAAQAYRQILQREPDNPDALQLLGALRHQQGDHATAAELIGKAVALKPNIAAFHVNLAEVYRVLGQLDRAADSARTAVQLTPGDADAHCNLGLVLRGLDRHGEAANAFRAAVNLRPDFALAHLHLGISLRDLGQQGEALTHGARAVELAPDDAQAQDFLGQTLVDLARSAEALPHFQRAVHLLPNQAALRHNLGNVLLALGQAQDAKVAYLDAIRLDPTMSQSYAGLGLAWQREGKLGDALAWLKRAVDVQPDDRLSWERLAELHRERDEPADTIACWRRVVASNPDRAASYYSLARALHAQGHSAEAEQHYQTALRLKPDLAEAHSGLAAIWEERGDLTAAEAGFRESLRLKPSYTTPHARLAALLRGRLPDADFAALRQCAADPQLTVLLRAELLFAQAQVQDARGDYPAAAASANQANALMLTDHKQPYKPAENGLFVDRIIHEFSPVFFTRTAGMGLPTRRPVFVFGLPRSGTTLIEQILASHPQVHGAGEVPLVKETFNSMPTLLRQSAPPIDCVGSLDAPMIQRLAEHYETQLTALATGAPERIVNKMPDNYMLLGFLATLFPRATFIHCRRNLRDVAVSCWLTNFRSILWANDVVHLASRFEQYGRLMDYWRTVLPAPILEVDYEETVADLENVARRLIEWCGLAWDPACVRFHKTQRPIRTASVMQVRQPIYTQSVGRWRHYERELAELFARLPGT